MSDNLTIRKPLDATRIDVNEDYELNYWSNNLNARKSEIIQAVKKVGTSVSKVRKYLGK